MGEREIVVTIVSHSVEMQHHYYAETKDRKETQKGFEILETLWQGAKSAPRVRAGLGLDLYSAQVMDLGLGILRLALWLSDLVSYSVCQSVCYS